MVQKDVFLTGINLNQDQAHIGRPYRNNRTDMSSKCVTPKKTLDIFHLRSVVFYKQIYLRNHCFFQEMHTVFSIVWCRNTSGTVAVNRHMRLISDLRCVIGYLEKSNSDNSRLWVNISEESRRWTERRRCSGGQDRRIHCPGGCHKHVFLCFPNKVRFDTRQ